jgi:hypothetical protein
MFLKMQSNGDEIMPHEFFGIYFDYLHKLRYDLKILNPIGFTKLVLRCVRTRMSGP